MLGVALFALVLRLARSLPQRSRCVFVLVRPVMGLSFCDAIRLSSRAAFWQ